MGKYSIIPSKVNWANHVSCDLKCEPIIYLTSRKTCLNLKWFWHSLLMTCIRFSGGTIEANRAFVGVFTLFQVSILPPQCKSNPSARFKSHLERKGELRVKVYSSIEKAFSVHKRTLVQNRCWAFEDLAEVAILISSHRQACLSSMSHASFNNGAFAYYDSICSFCFLN